MSHSELVALGIVLAVGLAGSAALIPLVRSLYRRAGLVDGPDGRRKHQQHPIPLAGGTAVLLAVTAAVVVAALVGQFSQSLLTDPRLWSVLIAAWLIGFVGWLDDRRRLRVRYKLIGQLIAISVLLFPGHLDVQQITLFGFQMDLGYFGSAFAILWMLGAINAINLLDGMDGMLGTVGVIVCATFAIIATWGGQVYVAVLSLALAGALIGFLRYNLPPASVYLGDCGSMVVGLIVGALAIQGSMKGPAALTLAVPVAILIVPIFDTAAAIIRRKLTGRSIYTTDRGHLHHCLLRYGFDRVRVLLLVGALCALTAAGALASFFLRNDLYALIAATTVVVVLIWARLFGHAELKLVKERFVAALAAFRHGHTANRSHGLEVRLQGSVDWNRIWNGLTGAAETLKLRSVCLDVNAPALHEAYHARWDRFGSAADCPNEWKADLPLFLCGEVIGRLCIAGLCEPGTILPTLLRLADVVTDVETGAFKECRTRSVEPGIPSALQSALLIPHSALERGT